jgi:hypothetical protein
MESQAESTEPPKSWLGRYRVAVMSANIMAVAFNSILIWACWQLGNNDSKAFTLNILLCLLGAAIGWGAGILATPIAQDDTAQFAKVGQIISALVTGYIVSKLDRFLERVLYSSDQPNTIAWERFCLFLVALLVMLIVVFINRWYLHRFAPKAWEEKSLESGG